MSTVKESFDQANPNTIADLLRAIGFGNVLAGLRRQVIRASLSSHKLVLPNIMKCQRLVGVYARVGTGTPGAQSIQTVGATPSAGQVAQTHTGDVLFASADAWTEVDVEYEPVLGEVVSLSSKPVVSNTFSAPGALTLISAVGYTSAGATVALTVVAPGTSVTTGQVALAASKNAVNFASADSIVRADAVYIKGYASEPGAVLASTSNIL
jgi:hypothetical protein